jgi:type II secretory pathway pseudopilin PulG
MSNPLKQRAGAGRGFTLVEAMFSMLLVSLMMVAAMNTTGAAASAQAHAADTGRASLLAQALMSEILVQRYADPSGTSTTLGPDHGDTTSPATRAKFNDVDDYDGWFESPPQNPNGSVIGSTNPDGSVTSYFPGWSRKVSVVWVNASDLTTKASSETGVKRITVTVAHKNTVLATLVAIRANWPQP